jgi:topoisomerase-4 subunit A
MKELMEDNFLRYASYVILERAIPRIDDGLKPVQRRILHTLFRMHDGKLHKVANVAGQTMAFHPHGDAAIIDALVNMANKGFLLDMQGNFGNLFTGDPAAAGRYIETRLSPLARDTLFNPDLTPTIPSYDSRAQEPIYFPAKIPVLLLQGTDGIAVGMSTHILPHNFNELLKAQIAILQGKSYKLYPDFPTGGILDASDYDKGKGKVKLRVKIHEKDPKTIVISEICFGTTTESLIRSIDEAAKRGKIKIESINDYTAEKVEIEINLPRGQYAEEMINALYAYTECEVTLSSQVLVIKDNMPWETDVHQVLEYQTEKLQGYLKRELELEAERLKEKIFNKTLEQIFIENRLYKKLETIKSNEVIHDTVAESLVPYHKLLMRVPTHDDREKLLNIPIRRISRFDLDKNQEEIAATESELKVVLKDLKNIVKYTIDYLESMLKKYGKDFPRKTKLSKIEELDKRAIAEKTVKVGFDPEKGYVGTKVSGAHSFECSNFDKLLLMYRDGSYKVMNLPEKEYADQGKNKVIYAGVADKQTVMNVVYKDPETHYAFAKRFVVSQFILEKIYKFMEDGMELLFLSTDENPKVKVQFVPKVKQKVKNVDFAMKDVLVKGVSAKGVRIASRAVKKVTSA